MADEEKRRIGEIIRQARKEKGLTQKELAEKMGVTQSIIANYEAGRQNLTVDTLQKVAYALQVELSITLK